MMPTRTAVVLPARQWHGLEAAHRATVQRLTAAHLTRADHHLPHPVEDFLFTYYSLRPAQLGRWHPGLGIGLADPGERTGWRFTRVVDGVASVDAADLLERKATLVDFVERLLTNTAAAPGQFGCFGLHEWAMVYRLPEHDLRHAGRALRLGAAGTDDVVRSHQLRCSHHDAFRFFTPQARGLNLLTPDLDSRDRMEQPGCLHATMDLYKWAYKLLPAVSSELLLDCFRLARDVRELDMRASPYDLRDLGYTPVPIETPAGKAEYVAAQRDFADRGRDLRNRLIEVIGHLRRAADDRLDQA